jgi:hypothetical protein
LDPLAQLVGTVWLIFAGLGLAGYELYQLLVTGSFDALVLTLGLIMCVAGLVAAYFVIPAMDRPSQRYDN